MKIKFYCSLFSTIWKQQRYWCYFVFLLIIIMLMTKFESLQISSPYSIRTAESINDLLFAISSSFFVGIIIYWITVVFPFYRSLNCVSDEILEIFRAIKDTYRDFSGEFGNGNWVNDNKIVNFAITFITSTEDATHNKYTNQLLSYYSSKLNELYSLLIPYYSYLDFETRECITKIKTSKNMQHISNLKESNELLMHETAKVIIYDIVSHNKIIINIYTKLQKEYLK